MTQTTPQGSRFTLDHNARRRLLAEYDRVREIGRELQTEWSVSIPGPRLDEGARKLGLLRSGKVMVNGESEFIALSDYCIYDVRRDGRNMVDNYVIEFPPDEGTDRFHCLQGMLKSEYSLYAVEDVDPGFGLSVRNLMSNETILLIDVFMSKTVPMGDTFAGRLQPHDGFWKSSGAALPVGAKIGTKAGEEKIRQLARHLKPNKLGFVDPAPIIRQLLEEGRADNVLFA